MAQATPAQATPLPANSSAPSGEVSLRVRICVPIALGIATIAAWEFAVGYWQIPKFIFPAPSMIVQALYDDRVTLALSLWETLKVTVAAFCFAAVLGIGFAVLFVQSKVFEISLFPYAVILQV